MGVDGLNEFVKHYYPQLGKKALIIDDRGNGGGNVSPMITERLMRTPHFYTMHTNQTSGSVSPVGTFLGPKVLLVNETRHPTVTCSPIVLNSINWVRSSATGHGEE